MKNPPKRYQDVRVQITRTVFAEWPRYQLKKGRVLDGWIDKEGNFRWLDKRDARWANEGDVNVVIYPTHFKVLGKFYFRKAS